MGDLMAELTTPFTHALPPLTTEEFESLKIDIAECGVLVPIYHTEDGRVLDGHGTSLKTPHRTTR
jgi:hypothetical protein